MIDRNDKLSISRQARLLGISRGSVYYQPQGASEAELSLIAILTSCIWIILSWARAN